MRETDLAYAAGYLEADGSIGIGTSGKDRRHPHLRVSITSIDPEVLEWFKNSFGGSIYRRRELEGRKPAFVWLLVADRAMRFLLHIKPFLKCDRKSKVADLAIEFQMIVWDPRTIARERHGNPVFLEAYRAYRMMYRHLIWDLNTKGRAPKKKKEATR